MRAVLRRPPLILHAGAYPQHAAGSGAYFQPLAGSRRKTGGSCRGFQRAFLRVKLRVNRVFISVWNSVFQVGSMFIL